MKTKQFILFLFLILIITSCCKIRPIFVGNKFDLQGEYKYDGKYTGIDTVIRIDGYYHYLSGPNSRPLMFFANGEFTKGVVDEYGINDGIYIWGGYVIDNNMIRLQIVKNFSIKCIGATVLITEYYEIIDRNTLVRQKEFIFGFENSKSYYDTFDTLKFVQSDYLMKPENQKKILEQNWLRDYKRNWKEGFYPGDKK